MFGLSRKRVWGLIIKAGNVTLEFGYGIVEEVTNPNAPNPNPANAEEIPETYNLNFDIPAKERVIEKASLVCTSKLAQQSLVALIKGATYTLPK